MRRFKMRLVPCVAIACIAAVEVFALSQGIDGALLGVAIAAIAGLGGYELRAFIEKNKRGKK